MSVLSPRRTDEEEPIHGRTDRRDPARVRRRRQGRGARAPARCDGSDALSLEAQVRRAPGERGEAAARPRGRESPLKRLVADQALNLQVVKDLLGKKW